MTGQRPQGRRKDFNGGLIGSWGAERAFGKTGAKKALEEVEGFKGSLEGLRDSLEVLEVLLYCQWGEHRLCIRRSNYVAQTISLDETKLF